MVRNIFKTDRLRLLTAQKRPDPVRDQAARPPLSGLLSLLGAGLALCLFLSLNPAQAQQTQQNPWTRPSLSFYGVPGLLEMPTGHAMLDADLGTSIGVMEGNARLTLYFQFTDRISGVFRYVYLDDFADNGDYYDRGFDVRYMLTEEDTFTPAITIGLQDFGGTGIYASEYLTATKTFGNFRVTGGLGWGRFGSYNGFTNPVPGWEVRPTGETDITQTGRLDLDQWFRGDVALFGGIEYQATERLRFALEYSSDDKETETSRGYLEHNTPINVGFDYAINDILWLRASYLYGSAGALQLTYVLNPKQANKEPNAGGRGPLAVAVRPQASATDLGWTANLNTFAPQVRDLMAEVLAPDGIEIESMALTGDTVQLRFRNGDLNTAQAIGRVARVLSRGMPPSVETFEIVPVTDNGLPISRVTIQRRDLEELVHAPDGAWQSFARARIEDSAVGGLTPTVPGNVLPRRGWGLSPYIESSFFDPSSPLRLDLGVQLDAYWEPISGLVFDGTVRQRLVGSRDDLPPSNSELEPVRSNNALYAAAETTLRELTVAKYFRPGKDLYGRVTLGYLESMHAGISTELLWKPVDSRLAFGGEVNYTRQRDFEQGLSLQDYEVVTGHLSTYYKTAGDYHYQLDLGRYLAGDYGGTLSIDREFDNGTRIGVFATLTDVPFDEFGEGSFDKGVRLNIPFSVFTKQPSDRGINRVIRPVQRDGGARLIVPGRLYGSVRSWQEPALQDQWGRFWR